NGFIAGTAIGYDPSYITTGHDHQALATGFQIGQRFHSAKTVRIADGCPVHLGHQVKADGRWRLFIFADSKSPLAQDSASASLIHYLAHNPASPVLKYTPEEDDIDAVIDVYTVFQQHDLTIETLPAFIWPAKGKYGLRDYEKAFQCDPEHDIFKSRGIDRKQGCVVIVRPDQHIANILPLDAHEALSGFFDEFMLA
ncbi:3-hydroxybenzoate 4-monooxygenase, partial [Oceanospirillum sp. HFRX-1_2]